MGKVRAGVFLIARDGVAAFTAAVSHRYDDRGYDDLEQLEACFDGWDVELIQLGPRRQTGWASMAALPSSRVFRVHAGRSVVVRGTTPAIGGCLMLSAAQKAAIRWLGQPIDASRFALAGRRARIDMFLPYDATLCVITVESLARVLPQRVQIHTATPECISKLIRCVESATPNEASSGAGRPPQAIDDVLTRQICVVMEASAPGSPGTNTRSRRVTAVARACRFIDSHLGKPISLADLCRHCDVGVRTLEYGFRQLYDTTPIAFIKNQRLMRTHRLLTQVCALPASISETARRMGFTHMGQYAQDYRSLFGESPTMTLQHAQRRRHVQPDENTALPETASDVIRQ